MEEETKPGNRNRNTALVLIGVGLFLLLEHTIGLFPLLAAFLILLGIHRWRAHGETRRAFVLIGIGGLILLGNHMSVVLAIVLIGFGLYLIRSKRVNNDDSFQQKHKFIDSIRWGKEPWILRSTSIWHVVGETNIDLSLAILEQRETTLVLQGIVGDVDIKVPEDIGVTVSASVVFGQIDAAYERETGVMNKLEWQSPNADACDHRVKLIISFLAGNVTIKIV